MRILSYLIIAFLFINTSCKSKQVENNNKKENTTNAINEEVLPFIELLSGSHSNIQEQKFVVLKNENELNTILSTINSTRMPNIKIPKIDFTKNIVIGLFMGTKSTGGHFIKINHISQTKNEVIVYYSKKHPTGMATSVITQPFYLAKMTKTNKNIQFELVEN